MKFLRLTILITRSMHIINMYSDIKYLENICNRLRDIQQNKNRKFRNVKCWQRTSLMPGAVENKDNRDDLAYKSYKMNYLDDKNVFYQQYEIL